MMVRTLTTWTVNTFDTFCGVAPPSVTSAVKVNVPAAVDEPLKRPAGDNVTPPGNVPVAAHVYGRVPPVAIKVWE